MSKSHDKVQNICQFLEDLEEEPSKPVEKDYYENLIQDKRGKIYSII